MAGDDAESFRGSVGTEGRFGGRRGRHGREGAKDSHIVSVRVLLRLNPGRAFRRVARSEDLERASRGGPLGQRGATLAKVWLFRQQDVSRKSTEHEEGSLAVIVVREGANNLWHLFRREPGWED
jgi:hypothetical protein